MEIRVFARLKLRIEGSEDSAPPLVLGKIPSAGGSVALPDSHDSLHVCRNGGLVLIHSGGVDAAANLCANSNVSHRTTGSPPKAGRKPSGSSLR